MTPRIGLVTPWASRLGGGVFEAVVEQARLIRAMGIEPIIFALEDARSAQDRIRFGSIDVRVFRVTGPKAVGYAPTMLRALLAARLDVLHLHGIWMAPSFVASRWAARTGRPYIISPHGMLDRWITSRGRAKKMVARLGYERRSWARAACFHALTQDERTDVVREVPGAQCVIVPNAVSIPERKSEGPEDPPTILSIGRIHPKKNLSGLIEGWRLSRASSEGWRLNIAGWGDETDIVGLRRHLASIDDPSIAFLGPLFGDDKAKALASARFIALPSHSEGLPMAILESWAASRPTIMSANCHLPEGFATGAALDSGTDAMSIGSAIDHAVQQNANAYSDMASSAYNIVRDFFSADVVMQKWKNIYTGLTSQNK